MWKPAKLVTCTESSSAALNRPPHRRKSPSQCPMNRGFCRSAECLRRVRIRQPHKVPADATNSRVQLHCHGPHRLCPSLGKRLLTQSELTRQDDIHPAGISCLSSLLSASRRSEQPVPARIGRDRNRGGGYAWRRMSRGESFGGGRNFFLSAADLIPAAPTGSPALSYPASWRAALRNAFQHRFS